MNNEETKQIMELIETTHKEFEKIKIAMLQLEIKVNEIFDVNELKQKVEEL